MSMSTKHVISFETRKQMFDYDKFLKSLSNSFKNVKFEYKSCYEGAWSYESTEIWDKKTYVGGKEEE